MGLSTGEGQPVEVTEEVPRSCYDAALAGSSLPVPYLPGGPPLVRSQPYDLGALQAFTIRLLVAGVLFLPGWTSLLAISFRALGPERWYAKYLLLVPLVAYLSALFELGTLHLRGDPRHLPHQPWRARRQAVPDLPSRQPVDLHLLRLPRARSGRDRAQAP